MSFSSSATASSPARSTAYWVPSLATSSITGHTSAHSRRGSSKGRAPYRAALCRVYSCECLQHLSAAPVRWCCKPRVERPLAPTPRGAGNRPAGIRSPPRGLQRNLTVYIALGRAPLSTYNWPNRYGDARGRHSPHPGVRRPLCPPLSGEIKQSQRRLDAQLGDIEERLAGYPASHET